MEFSNITSIIAISISVITFILSLWDRLKYRPRLKFDVSYLPPQQLEENPYDLPVLRVEIINIGKEDVLLEYFYIGYQGVHGLNIVDTLWESEDGEKVLIPKGDKLTHDFTPDQDSILVDEDGNWADRLFAYTRMNTRHRIRGAKKLIQEYLNTAAHY
ncbi:MAG: hypothetical protein JW757_14125 [Anaerolineales bacterium]|nr:hypothetical protein [Anaerolineales bacterium]